MTLFLMNDYIAPREVTILGEKREKRAKERVEMLTAGESEAETKTEKKERGSKREKERKESGKNCNRHHAPPLRNTGKRMTRQHRAARTPANVTTLRHNARPSGEH